MKLVISLLVVSAMVAATLGAPRVRARRGAEVEAARPGPASEVERQVAARRALPALEHEEVHDEFGQYALRYVTAEGTVVSQRGRLVPTPRGDYVLVTEGEISYIGDDGDLYITKFVADLDGYHVETNHPLRAPELPELSPSPSQ